MNPPTDSNPTTIINVQPTKPGMYVTKMGAGIFGGLCFIAGGLAFTYVPVMTDWALTKTGLRNRLPVVVDLREKASNAAQQMKKMFKRTPVVVMHEQPTADQLAQAELEAEELAAHGQS